MSRWKPGPGWRREKNGYYYPHVFTSTDFMGAQVVAVVFKVAACLALLGGAVAAWRADADTHDYRVVLAVIASAIFTAATVAFFAYVLQLLLALHFESQLPAAAKLAEQIEQGKLTPPTRRGKSTRSELLDGSHDQGVSWYRNT